MTNISISILKKKITYGWKNDSTMPSLKVKFLATINNHLITCSTRMIYNPEVNDVQIIEYLKRLFK